MNRGIPRKLVAVVVLALAWTADALGTQPPAGVLPWVDSVFEESLAGGSTRRAVERSRKLLSDVLELYPGTTVAVAIDDRVVWSAGFGYANVARQVPVTPSTQFRIDRVSEALTSAALVKLAEEGRLDLDAPVQKYVPVYPEKGFMITSRQLAAHLAGIPAIVPPRPAGFRCSQPEEAVRLFAPLPLTRIPGSRFLHSRPGYVLLSAVISRACGNDFVSCLQEKIFKPAGMSSTLLDDPRTPAAGLAMSYERGWFGILSATRADTSCKWGAGGLVSTAEDLARFGLALLKGDVVKRESLPLLFSPQRTASGESTGHGLGWQIGVDRSGRRRLVQSGRISGGRSVVVLVPERKLTVALLANVDGEHLTDHAMKIAEMFGEE